MVEDVKVLVMEKYDFEHRDLSKLKTLLVFLDYQACDSRNGTNHFKIELSFKCRMLQFETLKQETKSLVMENHDLEYRKMSKSKTIFKLSIVQPEEQKSINFSIQNSPND